MTPPSMHLHSSISNAAIMPDYNHYETNDVHIVDNIGNEPLPDFLAIAMDIQNRSRRFLVNGGMALPRVLQNEREGR